MGRAPNSGAPQRVSAHVVPKVQPAFGDEERTTIESGWEDEPSTTVEQGEVAEKIRALNVRTPHTSFPTTNDSTLDEPTVDDKRANVAGARTTPEELAPHARLVITAGNDAGHELTVAPGKNYTIGRGIDGDLVLTDIAVSRKHFDLRYESGAWVIVDRGSGNGTLINGSVEDAPFMLTNGDTIEIGNTQFRIDIPRSPARPIAPTSESAFDAAALMTVDVPMEDDSADEDEPSTVNGAPIDDRATPNQMPPPQTLARPRTSPPPAPRSRAPSQALHGGAVIIPAAATTPPPNHAATMPADAPPMQQNAFSNHRPDRGPQQAPMMLDDRMGAPLPPIPAMTPPGQGMPLAPSQLPPDMMYGYPNMPRQGSPGPNGMLVVNTAQTGRDATSTALVPPTPYGGMPRLQQVPQPFVGPTISHRTKLILGGAALTILAAVATVAIIKGGDAPAPKNTPKQVEAKAKAPTTKPDVKPTEEPAKPDPKVVPKALDESASTKLEDEQRLAEAQRLAAEKKLAGEKRLLVEAKRVADDKKAEAREAKKAADETRAEQRAQAKRLADEKKQAAAQARSDRAAAAALARANAPKRPDTKTEPAAKRVAFDASGAKTKADAQYRAKNFSGAADTLAAAAKSAPSDDASDLNSLAAVYRQFGKAYNVGMAPGTSPKEAWGKLKTAQSMDNNAGNAFSAEIKAKMAQLAPKAAAAFMAASDYVSAKQAASVAEAAGTGGSTVAAVRSSLEAEAGKLYKSAQADASTDPDAATAKYKQIKAMVDAKSTWYQKAVKALER